MVDKIKRQIQAIVRRSNQPNAYSGEGERPKDNTQESVRSHVLGDAYPHRPTLTSLTDETVKFGKG